MWLNLLRDSMHELQPRQLVELLVSLVAELVQSVVSHGISLYCKLTQYGRDIGVLVTSVATQMPKHYGVSRDLAVARATPPLRSKAQRWLPSQEVRGETIETL